MAEEKKKSRLGVWVGVGLGVFVIGLLAAGLYFFVLAPSGKIPAYQSDTSGPDILFSSPLSGHQAEIGDTVLTHVTAADSSGIVHIELWINGVLSIAQSSPDSNGISPLTLYHGLKAYDAGTYTLIARAYNTSGAMTESPAVVVDIGEDTGGNDSPAIYEVQDGDDLDAIAAKAGISVADIKAANPGIQNVKSNQKIALPKNNKNNPPPNPRKNNLPGLQPQDFPQMLPSISIGNQGQVGHLLPEIAPDPGATIAGSPYLQGIPTSLSAKVDGCKVTITWKDNMQGEVGYAVYRRRDPDQVAPELVAAAGSNQTSYQDTVPYPADYEYQIEAITSLQNLAPAEIGVKGAQRILNSKRSQPYRVSVKPDANCIADPNQQKIIHFQIMDLSPKSSTHSRAAVWFSLNEGNTYRYPIYGLGAAYQDVINWKPSPQITIPLPASVQMNPQQPIILKFWSSAYTETAWQDKSEGPKDLGVAFVSHKIDELPPTQKTYRADGTIFDVDYKIWADDVKWDAKNRNATCLSSSPPTNLQVDAGQTDFRRITWKHEIISQPDGYLLYRAYSCPGEESKLEAPIYIPNKPVKSRQFDIEFRDEPYGCVYRYELAALSVCGQSKRSNALTGDSQSGDVLRVTFTDLTINSMPAGDFPAANITLRAGYRSRKSDTVVISKGKTNQLNGIILDGKQPNNTIELVLGPDQSPDIFFSVNGIDVLGDETFGSVCADTLTLPPVKTWPDKSRTEVINSFDGNCKMTVEFNKQSAQAAGSDAFLPEADLAVVDMATIGKQYYAKIVNHGPDQLAGNKFSFYPSFGGDCGGGKYIIDSPWLEQEFWISYNTPLWIYLGDYYAKNTSHFVDKYLAGSKVIGYSTRDGKDCPFSLFTSISPATKEGDSFIDPDEGNNLFKIRVDDLEPMLDKNE